MSEIQISKRLQMIASYIPKQAILADIGSDHAYLPSYAIKENLCKQAIAGEVAEGPFQSAVQQVKSLQLTDYIQVRKGNGLQVVNEKDHVNCITIAGMGGSLIRTILEEGRNKLTTVERLILQPNLNAKTIREWLYNENWELKHETILEENGHIYEILVAERGDRDAAYKETHKQAGLLLGPFLLKERNDIFLKKWREEERQYSKILQQLEQASSSNEVERKRAEIKDIIEIINGGLLK
ncbi:tRNA (adenine-N(1))-methyltransferase [Bacillus sp. HMF5848]|uniref:tRNA (adenine(22)-N(1))-methyltransferase n=1 Tax=Bacillus sp. HMF5848 TaxID=2495421 RepID=UPI000F779860|nr:tRNA (adenine(22)-N(1))-methyltransferase TrmK [Bacillus sp. HMF5848]RSK27873.1 tRNA (adenine-N(1))-methyltransferase [Bacillus sp. HMF5848]